MRHKAVIIIGLIIHSFATAEVVQAQDGYIQIVSEPGVSVFLNGELQGVTSTVFGGLIIQNVPAGHHTIRFVREGFNPQAERIRVRAGQVYVHTVRPFVPAMRITQEGEEGGQEIHLQVGSLIIQSLPVGIKISIPQLEVESSKDRDIWRAENIPVGNYSAVFTLENRRLEHMIAITLNQQTHLFVNMVENTVDELKGVVADIRPVRPSERVGYGQQRSTSPSRSSISLSGSPSQGRVSLDVSDPLNWRRPQVDELSFLDLGTPVTNPETGRTWMDRNMGASRTATSSTDAEAYGDLYQWGRTADGHQKRDSPLTSNLSSSDQPGHGSFIIEPNNLRDWRNPQNDNLWQGVEGINNPCPAGYRLPTEAEWEEERQSWSSNDAGGAFASPMKLPSAGYRSNIDGALLDVRILGYYWSSTVSGTNARYLRLDINSVRMYSHGRAQGFSVRCIKD